MADATKEFWPPANFIKQLEDKYGIKREGSLTVEGAFEVQRMDLTSLQSNVSSSTPFVVDRRLSGHKSVSMELVMQRFSDLRNCSRRANRPLWFWWSVAGWRVFRERRGGSGTGRRRG